MRRLLQAIIAVGAFLAAGIYGQTQESTEASVEDGQAIAVGTYSQSPGGACFRCHGMDGAGDNAAGFPRLTDQAYEYMVESLKDFASGERPSAIMQPIAEALSEQEMRDVSAYYASLEEAPYPPPPNIEPELLQQGAILSAIGAPEEGIQACGNCHGPEGIGLPPTYPFIGGQHASYIRQQLELFRSGERQGETGIMVSIASQMTDDQIEAAAQYFASLRPEGITPESGGRPVTTEAASPPEIAPIPEDIPGVE